MRTNPENSDIQVLKCNNNDQDNGRPKYEVNI